MFIDFAQFLFNLIIANFVLRYTRVKLTAMGYNDAAKALSFVG